MTVTAEISDTALLERSVLDQRLTVEGHGGTRQEQAETKWCLVRAAGPRVVAEDQRHRTRRDEALDLTRRFHCGIAAEVDDRELGLAWSGQVVAGLDGIPARLCGHRS